MFNRSKLGINNDPLLARVKEMVLKGWINTSEENLKPYQHRQNELRKCTYWLCIVRQLCSNSISRPPGSIRSTTPRASRHYENEGTGQKFRVVARNGL